MEEAFGLEIYTWDKDEGHEKVSVEENALSHLEPEEETGAAVWRNVRFVQHGSRSKQQED